MHVQSTHHDPSLYDPRTVADSDTGQTTVLRGDTESATNLLLVGMTFGKDETCQGERPN